MPLSGLKEVRQWFNGATMNARCNRISNVEFYASDLHLPMQDVNKPAWLGPYDKLLLDPPRTGAEEIVNAVANFSVRRLVYVSCNPATLAWDAASWRIWDFAC